MPTSGVARTEYYQSNKEAHIRRAKEWYLKNPEKRKEIVDRYRFSDKGLRTRWNSEFKRKYGITLDQYEIMQQLQENKCAICKQEETSKLKGVIRKLSVDHCHKTGIARKLLCNKCNNLLGRADDSIEKLQAAIDYLKEYQIGDK